MRAGDERACDSCSATMRVDPQYDNAHHVVRIVCDACGYVTFSTERWALAEYTQLVDQRKAI